MSNQIDVVIPWVDGGDPNHKAKRDKFKTLPIQAISSSVDDMRFEQSNEIYYCINSIIKFLPWIRNIYLVTDSQTPDFIKNEVDKYNKVIVIDHKDIFYDYQSYMPTFNSRTLTSLYWRIPGIASKFIVFNDDIVILKPLSKDCFINNNKVVLYGKLEKFKFSRELKILRKVWAYIYFKKNGILLGDRAAVAQKTARKIGFKDSFFMNSHMPMIYCRDIFENFFHDKDILSDQIKYKFRSSDQLLPESINCHTLIKEDKAIICDSEDFLLEFSHAMLEDELQQNIDNIEGTHCIAILQSVEKFPLLIKEKLYERLEKIVL